MEWRYQGKFVDRSPNIRAAGAPLKKCDKLSDCLKVYPVDDAIVTVLTEAGLHKVPVPSPVQRLKNWRHVGIYTNTQKVLNPPVDTRYRTLQKDLQETVWKSYWTKELGRTSDPIGAIPTKIDKDFIFGAPSRRDKPNLEELLNPPNVTPYELAFNDAEYHKMYTATHNDYFQGEQVNREYGPPFDKTLRYGSLPRRKASALCSIKLMEDKPLEVANKILADYIDRTHFRLGKTRTPNNNIDCVDANHRFGKKSNRPLHSLADLLHPNRKTSLFRKDFYSWLSALHDVRNTFHKRNVNFRELYGYCKYADINDTKWLDIQVFQRILLDNHQSFPHNDILPLAACFGIYNNEQVQYEEMLNLLNCKIKLPELKDFEGKCIKIFLFFYLIIKNTSV